MKNISLFILMIAILPLHAQDIDLQAQRSAAFDLLAPRTDVRPRLVQEKPFNFYENCEVMPADIQTIDPVSGRRRTMSVEIYRTRPKPDRGVLILPPTGGKNRLDEQWAEQFCDKGIEAWIVTKWDIGKNDYTLDEDLLSHDIAGQRGIVGIRDIVSLMPTSRIGVIGTSAGGILASVALALEPKISVGVLIAAGADMPEILMNSDLPAIRNLQRARRAANRWSADDYREQLRQSVVLDPLLFGEELQTKTVGTVVALRDRTVPVANQKKLEELSGARRILSFDSDHFGTILQTGLLSSYVIIDFFRDNL